VDQKPPASPSLRGTPMTFSKAHPSNAMLTVMSLSLGTFTATAAKPAHQVLPGNFTCRISSPEFRSEITNVGELPSGAQS